MPCTMTGSEEGDRQLYRSELEKKIAAMNMALCAACGVIENGGLKIPPEIAAWWEAHKAKDKHANEGHLFVPLLGGVITDPKDTSFMICSECGISVEIPSTGIPMRRVPISTPERKVFRSMEESRMYINYDPIGDLRGRL